MNKQLYSMLSNVVKNVTILCVAKVNTGKIQYSSMLEENKFVISKDTLQSNSDVVTAHILAEYKPSYLCIDNLIKQSHVLLIDKILSDLGDIRGVPIQNV